MRSPSSSPFWQALNNSILIRYCLLFACGWITVLIINYFYTTIALFSAAGIFAALLNYPVVWFSRYMPRGIAIAVTFLGTLVLLLALFAGVGLEVLIQGQGLLENLEDTLNDHDFLQFLPFQDALDQLDFNRVIETLEKSLASGLGIVQGIFSSVFAGIFGAVISLYMLIDGDNLWQSFLKLLPLTYRDRFANTFRLSFLGFIRGQLLLMLFLSISSFLCFLVLGVNYSLILAVIVGIIDAIPGIGATLAITLVTLLILISQGWALAVKVFIVCIILVQIQDNYVRPKVMGNILELDPVLLFLALFIGERVAGLLGIFLSIPIAGMIAIWIRSVREETQLQQEDIEDPE